MFFSPDFSWLESPIEGAVGSVVAGALPVVPVAQPAQLRLLQLLRPRARPEKT